MPRVLRNPRILLAAGVLLATVALVVVLIGGGASEDGGDRPLRTTRAKLTLERAVQPDTGYQELIVSVADRRINSLETTGGATSVTLRCSDRDGAMTIRRRHGWPMLEEAGYPAPHVHQLAAAKVLDTLARCRVTARGLELTGRVRGRLPSAG